MEMQWKYLINQFLVATRSSYKKALKLSNYHDAALKAALDSDPTNPDFLLLYNRYHPFHLEYVKEYTDWESSGGQQEGETLNIDQLLELLISKAGNWDAQVQVVHDKKTPQYKALFPDGRAPFYTGSAITRIVAVNTLSTALTGKPALAGLKTEVDTFYTLLDQAKDTQQGAIGITKVRSEVVNDKRILVIVKVS